MAEESPQTPKDLPPNWTKTSVPLPAGHQWKAAPGYQIFVGDGGAVRFEFPQGWVVRHEKEDTITFHDRKPPRDRARISLTVFRMPPMEQDWRRELPLEQLLRDALARDHKHPAPGDGAFHKQVRPDLELVWVEKSEWIDPENGKPLRCRQVLAGSRRVQVLATFDFYKETGEQFLPVWSHLLRSLRLEAPVSLDGSGMN